MNTSKTLLYSVIGILFFGVVSPAEAHRRGHHRARVIIVNPPPVYQYSPYYYRGYSPYYRHHRPYSSGFYRYNYYPYYRGYYPYYRSPVVILRGHHHHHHR